MVSPAADDEVRNMRFNEAVVALTLAFVVVVAEGVDGVTTTAG